MSRDIGIRTSQSDRKDNAMSEPKAVFFIYLVAGLMGLLAILVSTLKIEQAVFLFLYAAATFIIIGILLGVRRPASIDRNGHGDKGL